MFLIMVWGVIFLIFSSTGFFQSGAYFSDNERNELLKRWGISRVETFYEDLVSKKFSEPNVMVCEVLHDTSETPFAAIILYKTSGRLLCMGSIVDKLHVLTAKRCFKKADVSEIKVLAGYYKAYWGRHSQVRNAEQILRHEFEIALLKLNYPLKYNDYVQPVRLPAFNEQRVAKFNEIFPPPYKIVGFFVDRFEVQGDYIDKEQTYKVREDHFISVDDCRQNFTKMLYDSKKVFCTFGNATFCWGGMGAPILKQYAVPHYLQIGIVIADNCSTESLGPFLAARTDVYYDWVRGNSVSGQES